MSRRLLILIPLVLLLTCGIAFADANVEKQVGLVIAFPDGSQHLEIVTAPVSATTFELLEAASIDLVSDSSSGFGPAICSINAIGCPAENCFCDFTHFWAYFNLDSASGQWVAASAGAGDHIAADGDVEGFAWSGFDANYNATTLPSVYSFDQIVAETTPAPVPVPEPGTLLLLGSGLAGLAGYARRLRRR